MPLRAVRNVDYQLRLLREGEGVSHKKLINNHRMEELSLLHGTCMITCIEAVHTIHINHMHILDSDTSLILQMWFDIKVNGTRESCSGQLIS